MYVCARSAPAGASTRGEGRKYAHLVHLALIGCLTSTEAKPFIIATSDYDGKFGVLSLSDSPQHPTQHPIRACLLACIPDP